jgi:hypothetical protein
MMKMEISKKYRHIGYSYPGVPKGWKTIVEKAIVDIEKEMWPRWIPLFIKRWIHYLATGNSVVRVRSRFWYSVRQKLTRGQIITDIKDKFASLRIYGCYGDEIDEIITKAEDECYETCEKCGSKQKVKAFGKGWIYNLCKSCRYGKKK